MSVTRFYLLLRAQRLNNIINTRSERIQFDKPLIPAIFDKFVDLCKLNYTVGEYCTIYSIR